MRAVARQDESPITASDLAVSPRCAFVLHSGDVSVLSLAPGWPFGELRENWTTLAAEGNFSVLHRWFEESA